MIRRIKQKLKRAYYWSQGLMPEIHIPVTTVNPGEQAWYFNDESLSSDSIIYSLGLATNIEFDLRIIEKYGAHVHGFDPTPESVKWIEAQDLPAQFHHHPVAIAGHDGEISFQPPDQASNCSRATAQGANNPQVSSLRSQPSFLVPCKKLSTIMSEQEHSKIDLLKMDIEGAEYDVLEDLLGNELQISQILVEFHHRFPGIGIQRTLDIVKKLRDRGYLLFHVSPWCEEFAFIRK